jgi:hypothetical protein
MKPPLTSRPTRATKLRNVIDLLDGEPAESEPDAEDDLEFDDLDDDFEFSAEAPPASDARPNPVELPAPINPEGGRKQSVETHRNLFCGYYDHCLDEAVKRAWNSFSCFRCGLYRANREVEEGGVARFATQRRAS